MKILCFDTETTGLNPESNDIIDLGMILIVDKEVVFKESIRMQPFDWTNIAPEALETNGFTIADLKTFPDPVEQYRKIICTFSKYVDKYNKLDRFFPMGYNVQFDLNFLAAYFRKADPNNEFGLGSWIQWILFDLMQQLRNDCFRSGGKKKYENFKLETIAKAHGFEFKAHNALEDATVTLELIKKYLKSPDTF